MSSLLKRKLTNKTVVGKYKAKKGLERGMTNKDGAEKYGVPYIWPKNIYGEELQFLVMVLKMDMLLCKERLESCKQCQVIDYFNIMK